jgi:putative CRISPR-associated protein (TIGR02619 family)
MKETHIVTCGISSIINFARAVIRGEFKPTKSIGRYILEKLADPRNSNFVVEKEEIAELYDQLVDFIKSNPRRASAEINALFGYLQERGLEPEEAPKLIEEVHLLSSDTVLGNLSARALEGFLKSILPDVPVYLHPVMGFQTGNFEVALINLKEKVREISRGKKVVLNLTGGFKAEIAALSALAAESGFRAYYIHEIGKRTVELPSSSELKVRLTRKEKILGILAVLLSFPYELFLGKWLFPVVGLLLMIYFITVLIE